MIDFSNFYPFFFKCLQLAIFLFQIFYTFFQIFRNIFYSDSNYLFRFKLFIQIQIIYSNSNYLFKFKFSQIAMVQIRAPLVIKGTLLTTITSLGKSRRPRLVASSAPG